MSDAERRLVNERLKQGDFQPGDRIVLLVAGETALSDTFTVKPGKTVALPNLPDISLDGVLRSELTPYLSKQLGRYIRDVDLTATPLVRVAVLGAVGRPGFYNLPADALATDAITLAGGPAANADITKTMVQRGGAPLYTKDEMTEALQRGSSLDQLNVQSGDELVVGTKSEGIRGTLTTLGLVSGILFGVVAATRIF
ncbi:MAG TPA: polysaccharide biosynthesis/export family protein [Gemmatimonadales bacterium]|nr:polysaccharide biosynthesis/export family protein [Gemmatimonadales bacterium]